MNATTVTLVARVAEALARALRGGAAPDSTPACDLFAEKLAPRVAAAIIAASRDPNDVMEWRALEALNSDSPA